jgi:hypothetical protein
MAAKFHINALTKMLLFLLFHWCLFEMALLRQVKQFQHDRQCRNARIQKDPASLICIH